MFILDADGRDEDVSDGFARYQTYLEANKLSFPKRAYELATSDWYFDFTDHRCPHDAWIEEVVLTERPDDSGRRRTSLTVRLLGAYHDGFIELTYPRVFAYSLAMEGGVHCDWRYDELRVSESGRLIHEIEWWGALQTGRWLIEASDLEHRWLPKPE